MSVQRLPNSKFFQLRRKTQEITRFPSNESENHQEETNLLGSKDKNSLKPNKHNLYKNRKRAFSHNIFKNAHILDKSKEKLVNQTKYCSLIKSDPLTIKTSKISLHEDLTKKPTRSKVHFHLQNVPQSSKISKSCLKGSKSKIVHTVEYKIPGFKEIKDEQNDGTLTKLIMQNPDQSSIPVREDESFKISETQSKLCNDLLKQFNDQDQQNIINDKSQNLKKEKQIKVV